MSSNKLRLFALRQKRKGKFVASSETGQPLFFHDKMEAKKVRDALGGTTVVTLGPDHFKYDGGDN